MPSQKVTKTNVIAKFRSGALTPSRPLQTTSTRSAIPSAPAAPRPAGPASRRPARERSGRQA